MKSLLILPIIANPLIPLNTINYEETENNIRTEITFNSAERTNAENTYEYIDEQYGETLYIYQKYGTQSTINNYSNIQINNYCQMIAYEAEAADAYTYDLETYVIMQITPYKNVETSNTYFNINFNVNDIYNNDFLSQNAQYSYSFYRTETNLSNQINTNNWAYKNAIDDLRRTGIDNNQNKYLLKQQQPIYTQYPNDQIINIENIPLTLNKTCFVVASIRIINTINTNDTTRQYPLEPTINTELLHTQEIVIYSTKAPIQVNTEVVDIAGLMFTILGLPFSFISQAFDLTIFEGTPYQINISKLFLGFIAIAMLLWVLKIILGRADFGQLIQDHKIARDNRRAEMRRHKSAMQQRELEHNNRVSEQRMAESNRHVRQTHKDGKS